MIDGLKLVVDKTLITQNNKFDFERYGKGYRAKYKNLILSIRDNSLDCVIDGSIHKFYNNGEHNYNDFKLSSFIDAVETLCNDLNIDAELARIIRLEVGLNIYVPISVENVIKSIKGQGNKPFYDTKIGKELDRDRYRIKIYTKHLNGEKEKLRFEKVFKKKIERDNAIKNYTPYCNTLADLINSKIWRAFANDLIETFKSFYVFQDIDIEKVEEMTESEVRELMRYQQLDYWLKTWTCRHKKQRHLQRYREIIIQWNKRDIKEEILQIIIQKISDLIDVEVIPEYLKTPRFAPKLEDNYKSKIINNIVDKNSETPRFAPVDKRGQNVVFDNSAPGDKRVCLVTGLSLDINTNPRQQKTLSAKGVEYYYLNERDMFDKVLYPLLTDKAKSKSLEYQFKAIAQIIRNNRSNAPNNLKRDLRKRYKGVNMIFDIEDMICKDKECIYVEVVQRFGKEFYKYSI